MRYFKKNIQKLEASNNQNFRGQLVAERPEVIYGTNNIETKKRFNSSNHFT